MGQLRFSQIKSKLTHLIAMAREMFTPQETKMQQRVLLLATFSVGAFVAVLQFFPEAPFAIPVALALWCVGVGAMLFVASKVLRKTFEHYWPRR